MRCCCVPCRVSVWCALLIRVGALLCWPVVDDDADDDDDDVMMAGAARLFSGARCLMKRACGRGGCRDVGLTRSVVLRLRVRGEVMKKTHLGADQQKKRTRTTDTQHTRTARKHDKRTLKH